MSSAIAASAYAAREMVPDEWRREVWDYTPLAHDLVHAEVLLPEHAPERWSDRAVLWNEVEQREPRVNALLARNIVLTLPRELPINDNVELARRFISQEFVARGMVADFAVHEKTASDGLPQPHAHALLTTRQIEDGRFGNREQAWGRVEMLHRWRRSWAETINRGLEAAGHAVRVQHERLVRSVLPAIRSRAERDAAWLRPFVVQAKERVIQAARDLSNDRWVREVLPAGVAKVREVVRGERAGRAERPAPTREDRPAPAPPEAPADPIAVLRERLRVPIRTAALGIAAAGWNYGEEQNGLVCDHLLPVIAKFPELEPKFDELVDRIGNALAVSVEKQEARIAHNAAILRERFSKGERAMPERERGDERTTQAAERAAPLAVEVGRRAGDQHQEMVLAQRREHAAQQQRERTQDRSR